MKWNIVQKLVTNIVQIISKENKIKFDINNEDEAKDTEISKI